MLNRSYKSQNNKIACVYFRNKMLTNQEFYVEQSMLQICIFGIPKQKSFSLHRTELLQNKQLLREEKENTVERNQMFASMKWQLTSGSNAFHSCRGALFRLLFQTHTQIWLPSNGFSRLCLYTHMYVYLCINVHICMYILCMHMYVYTYLYV